MSVLLQLINLSFARQHKVLCREIHLSIHDGDRMALVGHNGSGKTSLLHIKAGRERPDAGEIRTVQHLRIALVEQFVPASINPMSLRDAVLIHMTEEQRWSEGYVADALLQQLGFTTAQFSLPVSGLSGGQQNLLLIARAMVQKPQLLLLDEPTAGVDMKTQHDILHLLRELNGEGMTILLTTHDLHTIASHVPWVMCFNRGIVAQGPPAAVLTPSTLRQTYDADMTVVTQDGMTFIANRSLIHRHADARNGRDLSRRRAADGTAS